MGDEKFEIIAACIVVFCMAGTAIILVGILTIEIIKLFQLFQ